MLKSSSSRFDPLEIGSTVRISIPDVDRARGAPRNLLAVVVHVENDLYKLCEYPHINYSNIHKKWILYTYTGWFFYHKTLVISKSIHVFEKKLIHSFKLLKNKIVIKKLDF